MQAVGIFVNPTLAQVQETVECSGLDWVQLSGTEPPAVLRGGGHSRSSRPCGCRSSHRQGEALPDDYDVDLLLADAAVPGSWGGSGEVSDWPAACRLARRRRLLLAGGLHAGNVAAAIQTVRPAGVDVASGIETDGREDPVKIRGLCRGGAGGGVTGLTPRPPLHRQAIERGSAARETRAAARPDSRFRGNDGTGARTLTGRA